MSDDPREGDLGFQMDLIEISGAAEEVKALLVRVAEYDRDLSNQLAYSLGALILMSIVAARKEERITLDNPPPEE